MPKWSSKQYLKFENQRTQPARDLAMRISNIEPETVIDIGCGPGNSTRVLKSVFPNADILGIDNSENMIENAKKENPDIRFGLCDAVSFDGNYDIIFSNACLQWISEHDKVIPLLMDKLNIGGTLAVQMPFNYDEPLYRMIEETVNEPEWGFDKAVKELNITLKPTEYHNILTRCSSSFDVFEIKYYHTFTEHQDLVDWVKGTKLRPHLECLDDEMKIAFEAKIVEKAEKLYPRLDNGDIIFGFNRLFFVAHK